jgi:FtsH-binding integral membrane protein
MALTYFVLFPNPHLMPNQPLYWFMMQIGMVFGFFTSYPMNRLLIKWDTKEAMDNRLTAERDRIRQGVHGHY